MLQQGHGAGGGPERREGEGGGGGEQRAGQRGKRGRGRPAQQPVGRQLRGGGHGGEQDTPHSWKVPWSDEPGPGRGVSPATTIRWSLVQALAAGWVTEICTTLDTLTAAAV